MTNCPIVLSKSRQKRALPRARSTISPRCCRSITSCAAGRRMAARQPIPCRDSIYRTNDFGACRRSILVGGSGQSKGRCGTLLLVMGRGAYWRRRLSAGIVHWNNHTCGRRTRAALLARHALRRDGDCFRDRNIELIKGSATAAQAAA